MWYFSTPDGMNEALLTSPLLVLPAPRYSPLTLTGSRMAKIMCGGFRELVVALLDMMDRAPPVPGATPVRPTAPLMTQAPTLPC